MTSVREQLKIIFSVSAFSFEQQGSKHFAEILLKLSGSESDKLVQRSLHLLNRHFSAEDILFRSAVQTQLLLTEKSKEVSTDFFSMSSSAIMLPSTLVNNLPTEHLEMQ